jgi:hypothetical protein
MNKLTPFLALAAVTMFVMAAPVALAQAVKPDSGASSITESSYSPPLTSHKKKPRKPRKAKKVDMAASQQ